MADCRHARPYSPMADQVSQTERNYLMIKHSRSMAIPVLCFLLLWICKMLAFSHSELGQDRISELVIGIFKRSAQRIHCLQRRKCHGV